MLMLLWAFSIPATAKAQQLYWENPQILDPNDAVFVRVSSGGGRSAALWHEFTPPDNERNRELYLSLAVKEEDSPWRRYNRTLGPFRYVGERVPVASLLLDREGKLFVALAISGKEIAIYRSDNGGQSFRKLAQPGFESEGGSIVAPRLFLSSQGKLMLFVTSPINLGQTGSLTDELSLGAAFAVSENGTNWSNFTPLVSGGALSYIYLPHHRVHNGIDYVAFQASPPESRYYQLYLVNSVDGGSSWSEPKRISDFSDTSINENGDPELHDNQRPFLYSKNGELSLVWERRFGTNTPPQIFYAPVEPDGRVDGTVERITDGFNVARNPGMTEAYGKEILYWFDNSKGENRIFVASREGIRWQRQDVSIMDGVSVFPAHLLQDGELYLFWENNFQNSSRVVLLAPDRSAAAPRIQPLDFPLAAPARQDSYSISWTLPDDSSGISGFAYSLDRDPQGRPAERLMLLRRENRRFSGVLTEDGSWYFHLIARDYAGNWSETVTVEAVRDTTPPSPVTFPDPELDEAGYLPSNTWTLSWEAPPEEDLGGYAYRLQYLTGNSYDAPLENLSVAPPVGTMRLENEELSFRNIDNGIWGLAVAPVDEVGNVGEAAFLRFRLNKYIPVTYITTIDLTEDDLGQYLLRIRGRGFSVGGEISDIYLDRDREAPYDYRFTLEGGSYQVTGDRSINGPVIDDIEGGRYYLGIVHPTRGTYFASRALTFTDTGTVKFGDFTILDREPSGLFKLSFRTLSGGDVAFYLVMLLLLIALLVVVTKLFRLSKEAVWLRMEAVALIESREMPHEERKERINKMKKERKGLRLKFGLLVTFLVLIIVLLVSIPLGQFMIETQQKNLTDGLQQSTQVLVESIASGAVKFLPEENTLELGRLPAQSRAAEDARYITITGPVNSIYPEKEQDHFDYLWASNDPVLEEKLQYGEDEEYSASDYPRGGVRISDRVSPAISSLEERINREADEAVGALAERLSQLQEEAQAAANRMVTGGDEDTAQLLRELQDEIASINREIEEKLSRIGSSIASIPEFNPETILSGPSDYVFYRPLVYQDSSRPGVFYHGLVRLGISTERIQQEINSSREQLIRRSALIAAGAVLLGIIGALILSSIIIIPINKLVRGVQLISETEDKEKLKDHVIRLRSRDELAQLADTINEMTQGLAKAAAANKDLTIGKEVQKMFIPLEADDRGNKLTTGANSYPGLDFFGYYEGAKGVSGDYFDYMQLPGNLYAIIKCDVAGKGVPASLIMVEVATIFRNYLTEWQTEQERIIAIARSKGVKPKKQEPQIEKMVSSINHLVQERGFKGRFAAFIVVLIDGDTGKTTFCHAGDNLVHIFDGEKQGMEVKTLPQAPAAGVFPNDLVEMQGGFPKIGHMLQKGDRLFLFTDGIEEAQRKFRDSAFAVVTCQEPNLEQGELHDTHPVGNDNEELGIPRIQDVINTFYTGGVYTLHKYHDPQPENALEFDFSGCSGSIDQAVLAVISVEKIFRLNPDPKATVGDIVEVDGKIDAFLKERFRQYTSYFPESRIVETKREGFVAFAYLKEDEQYDDLTILGVEKG
jgi:hypothetical protein